MMKNLIILSSLLAFGSFSHPSRADVPPLCGSSAYPAPKQLSCKINQRITDPDPKSVPAVEDIVFTQGFEDDGAHLQAQMDQTYAVLGRKLRFFVNVKDLSEQAGVLGFDLVTWNDASKEPTQRSFGYLGWPGTAAIFGASMTIRSRRPVNVVITCKVL